MELSAEQLALILQALGREKSWLNASGFRESAHKVSELQSYLKNKGED